MVWGVDHRADRPTPGKLVRYEAPAIKELRGHGIARGMIAAGTTRLAEIRRDHNTVADPVTVGTSTAATFFLPAGLRRLTPMVMRAGQGLPRASGAGFCRGRQRFPGRGFSRRSGGSPTRPHQALGVAIFADASCSAARALPNRADARPTP